MSSIVIAWLTPSLMLLMTYLFGTNGKRELVRNCGPLTQLLSCKISADIPRVPASAGLSLVATCFYWSTLVYSKILQTRFATKIGCFSFKLIHWRTVVLSVHMYTWLTVTVSACVISFFSRAASRAACNSSFGTVITFIGTTSAYPKTNASSAFSSLVGVFARARKNATALKISWELSPNIYNSILSKGPLSNFGEF